MGSSTVHAQWATIYGRNPGWVPGAIEMKGQPHRMQVGWALTGVSVYMDLLLGSVIVRRNSEMIAAEV